MRLGANGYPYGWSAELHERWNRIRNDSAQSAHWNRLSNSWKYLTTLDPQYISSNLVNNLVSIWQAEGFTTTACGTKPYLCTSTLGTDSLQINFSNNSGSISTILALIQTDNKIKISGTALPSELTANNNYYVVEITNTLIFEGNTDSSALNKIVDASADFVTLGVQVGDLLVKTSTNQAFSVNSFTATEIFSGTNRTFTNGNAYQIRRVTFKISSVEDGSPITFSSANSINFQPHDQVFYYPTGCNPNPNLDNISANFGAHAISYLIFYDTLTNDQKLLVNDVFKTLVNNLMYVRKVDYSDYDNYFDAWTSTTIFCLAIKDDFPVLYNKITNDPTYLAWYDGMTQRFQETFGGDSPDTVAMFWGGTNYDPATLVTNIQGIRAIENFSGVEYFPDLNRKLYKIGEGLKAYFCPTFTMTFQWSDTQLLYENYNYLTYNNLAVLADINKDPELWYMWDRVQAVSSRPFSSSISRHSPHDDPYATRATEAEWLARRNIHWNDSNLGISWYHTGRVVADDSIFYVNNWSNTHADHNPDGSDLQLYRKGEWMIDAARGYHGGAWGWYQGYNTIIPFNAFAVMNDKVQQDYQRGEKWMYTKGLRKNNPTASPYPMSTGGGNVIEQIREVFCYRLANGGDLVVVWDTLETPTGQTGTSTRTVSTTSQGSFTADNVPLNIKTVQPKELQKMYLADYKHQFQWCVPITTITEGTDTWTWLGNNAVVGGFTKFRAGTQLCTLRTFVDDYESEIFPTGTTEGSATYIGHPEIYPSIDLGVQSPSLNRATCNLLRIAVNNEQFGRFNWCHAFYARGSADAAITYTKSDTGLVAVVAGETVEITFLPDFQLTINGVVQSETSSSSSSSSSLASSSSSCRSSSSSCRSSSSSSSSSRSMSSSSSKSSSSSSSSSCRSSSSSCRSSSSSSRSSSSSSSSCRSSSSSSRSSSSSSRSSSSSSAQPAGIFFDAVSNGTATSGNVVVQHTINPAGFGHYLVVCLSWKNSAPITDITWDGVALVHAVTYKVSVYSEEKASIYYLNTPSTGTFDLNVNIEGNYDGIAVAVMSFTGTNQSIPEAIGGSTGTAGTISSTITTISDFAMLVDVVDGRYNNSAWTAGTGQVIKVNLDGGHGSIGASYKSVGIAGAQSLSWTYGSGGQGISHAAIALTQAGTVPSSSSSSSCRSSSSSSSSCRSSSSSSRSSSSSSSSRSSSSSCSSSSSSSLAGGVEDIVLTWVNGASSSSSSSSCRSSSCSSSSSSSCRSSSSSSSSSVNRNSSSSSSSASIESSSSSSYGWTDRNEDTRVPQ